RGLLRPAPALVVDESRARHSLKAPAHGMYIYGQRADGRRIEPGFPGRHHAAARAMDGCAKRRAVPAVEPFGIGEVGSSLRLAAPAVIAVTAGAVCGEGWSCALGGRPVGFTARNRRHEFDE